MYGNETTRSNLKALDDVVFLCFLRIASSFSSGLGRSMLTLQHSQTTDHSWRPGSIVAKIGGVVRSPGDGSTAAPAIMGVLAE
jgi:hypothetical protein